MHFGASKSRPIQSRSTGPGRGKLARAGRRAWLAGGSCHHDRSWRCEQIRAACMQSQRVARGLVRACKDGSPAAVEAAASQRYAQGPASCSGGSGIAQQTSAGVLSAHQLRTSWRMRSQIPHTSRGPARADGQWALARWPGREGQPWRRGTQWAAVHDQCGSAAAGMAKGGIDRGGAARHDDARLPTQATAADLEMPRPAAPGRGRRLLWPQTRADRTLRGMICNCD